MLSKKEIFDLINYTQYVEAIQELNEIFGKQNDAFNALADEFINRPGNFEIVSFTKRLKLFVSREYPETAKPKPRLDVDDYELLCELDFKTQTSNFQGIYKYKKIAAFLVHGETDEQGNDLNWLCNQMLHKEELVKDKSVIIDFDSKLGGSFERLLEELYLKFDVDTVTNNETERINLLRDEIEERLKSDHLVCIVRSPGNILHEEAELCKLFDDFFSFMNKHIVRKKHNHAFIFLFVDFKQVDYQSKGDKYFYWFDTGKQSEYSQNVALCSDLKIIDLAPVEKIKEKDISEWIGVSQIKRPDIFLKIMQMKNAGVEIFQTGITPFKLIEKICNDLEITIQAKWIS